MREKILEAFEVKNFTQNSTNSEISRCSYGLEKLTFCLETFFSKVSKKIFNGLMTLIFSLRHVFILVLDSCKIWRSYEKNSRKYSEKSDPPQIAIWGGGVCKYITCLTRLYLTCVWNLKDFFTWWAIRTSRELSAGTHVIQTVLFIK